MSILETAIQLVFVVLILAALAILYDRYAYWNARKAFRDELNELAKEAEKLQNAQKHKPIVK